MDTNKVSNLFKKISIFFSCSQKGELHNMAEIEKSKCATLWHSYQKVVAPFYFILIYIFQLYK